MRYSISKFDSPLTETFRLDVHFRNFLRSLAATPRHCKPSAEHHERRLAQSLVAVTNLRAFAKARADACMCVSAADTSEASDHPLLPIYSMRLGVADAGVAGEEALAVVTAGLGPCSLVHGARR